MKPTPRDAPPLILDRSRTDAEGWQCSEGLSKTEAESLLDWLEAHGYGQREVSCAEDRGFTVRWRK